MRRLHYRSFYSFIGLTALLLLSACASSNNTSDVYDPFEGSNRVVFAVNDAFDKALAKPVAQTYRVVLPEPARVGVRNVLRNLASPTNIANQLLQGDIGGAGNDVGRAVINTTLGVGGIFDVAGEMGLEYEPEDFGQTMGVWGIPPGPYFVVPVFGPSNLRDSTGRVVDFFADPLEIYLDNTNQEEWIYIRIGVYAVSQREGLLDVLDTLRDS